MQLDLDLKRTEWMKDGYCASYPDPDLWHYESSLTHDEKALAEWKSAEAIRMCRICPVKTECLAEGMRQENMTNFDSTSGSIWGGKFLGERLNIRGGKISYKYRKELSFIKNVYKKIAILDQ